MLFKNILDEKYRKMYPVVEKLLNIAFRNQTHYADLLLVNENAGYYKSVEQADNLPFKADPYTTGPQMEGHSEDTHHKFIGQYVKRVATIDYKDYLQTVVYDPERLSEVNKLNDEESMSIQIEMLIYIKIWESDTFIKKLYQVARLINGEDYDWHFKIKGFNKNDVGGLSRRVLIRDYVIEKLKNEIPELQVIFERCYSPQIRNAIAHSQYVILGRNISFNNYVESDAGSISYMTFEEWTVIFHETLVLYTLYHEFFIRVNDIYYEGAQENGNSVEIRISKQHPVTEIRYRTLYSRAIFKDWSPYKTE